MMPTLRATTVYNWNLSRIALALTVVHAVIHILTGVRIRHAVRHCLPIAVSLVVALQPIPLIVSTSVPLRTDARNDRQQDDSDT